MNSVSVAFCVLVSFTIYFVCNANSISEVLLKENENSTFVKRIMTMILI